MSASRSVNLRPIPAGVGAENEGLRALLRHPLLNGVAVEVAELPSGTNRVLHGLGRKPVGWIVVRKTGDANIWEGQDSDKDALYLVADSTDAQYVLWVY